MKFPWLFLSLIGLLACNPQPRGLFPGSSENCRGGRCYYSFVDDVGFALERDSLDAITDISLISVTDQRMFSYVYVKNDQENLNGDEYTELIQFIAPQSQDEFVLHFPLAQAQELAYVRPRCACPDFFWEITDGTIQGQALDADTWEIIADIEHISFDGLPVPLEFTASFTRSEN